jgi:RNA polymerase sigma-70 factor (ECF subfamily)
LSLNYIRDNQKNVYGDAVPDFAQENSEADNEIQASELQAQVVETLRELPDRSRKIFLMSRYGNLSNKSISEKLDISIKTVESHITSTLKALKARIFGKT